MLLLPLMLLLVVLTLLPGAVLVALILALVIGFTLPAMLLDVSRLK